MKCKMRVQDISFLYNVTRKKYLNLHKRITCLIKDSSFYELGEKIRKNMLRRLHLLYRRLLKLLSKTSLATVALTASFLMLSVTAEAQTFTEQTGTSNPLNGVDVGDNSDPFFLDLDANGRLDVFIGESDGNVNYFKNTGTALVPVFTEQTGTNNPLNGVDVGDNSAPSLVDIDNDGDMDAFLGEQFGTIKYYKNTGTALAPVFTEQTGTNNPLNGVDVGDNSDPFFLDLYADGRLDVFIGESDGNVNYFKNTGTALVPVFTEQTGTNNPLNGVDVGDNSDPFFLDLYADGRLDVFIGESDGNVNYFKNSSSLHTASFAEVTGTSNPLNGVDVGSESTPTFADIDSDGDMDAFLGGLDGNINYFKNTGTALTPSFTEQTGTNNPLDNVFVGLFSAPTFADIDSDGDTDAVVGKLDGTINYYKNTGTALAAAFAGQTGADNPFNNVDVGNRSFPTFIDIDGDGDKDAFFGESFGTIKYYKNTGTALTPTFTEQTGTNNPFNNVDVGDNATLIFADIDGDGDMDAFIGESGGTIKTYADGTTTLPVELTTFTAILQNNSVVLNWHTATEVNNYGFEVERTRLRPSEPDSAEASWEKIGFVKGHGNSNSPKDYTFTDNDLIDGTVQYRLKQIDTDGQYEYSGVVEVKIGLPDKYSLSQNYPNPFNPSTIIKFSLPQSGNVILKVINLLGEEVKVLVNEFREVGKYEVKLNGVGLASGVYFYSLHSGEYFEIKKMILLK